MPDELRTENGAFPILSSSALSGGYGKREVIKKVDLSIKAGDFVGVIGPNGSGKSTLLRLLTKALKRSGGDIRFKGRSLDTVSVRELASSVAFVPQDITPVFSYTVFDIVLMGRMAHMDRLSFETRSDIALAERSLRLTDTYDLRSRMIDELSAGERQRVIIARALAQEPELIFLDEPTSHLDIGQQVNIMNLLKELNKEHGLSIAVVLHDLNLAGEYCDRIVLMDDGAIVSEGDAGSVLTYENIEKVYHTVVIVKKNSISGKPFVMTVAGEKACLVQG